MKPTRSEKKDIERLEIKKAVELALAKMPLGSNRERPENLAEHSDSDDEAMKNRIGNVPLWWYKDEDHIGYDIYGNKIMKKDHGDSIDAFLARTDDPNAFRTVYDELNDEKIVLTDEELSIINRIRHGKFPHRDFDPYQEYNIPLEIEHTSLTSGFLPKSSFMPSKSERKMVLKYIHSIRNGWLRDPRLPPIQKKVEDAFDIWGDNDENPRESIFIAPQVTIPSHVESYNPPEEYLFSNKERAKQENIDPQHRKYNFWPTKYNALRNIPGFESLITERYKRCMELFLAVRFRKNKKITREKLETLIPNLPKPKDLKPFPAKFSLEYLGHTNIIRSIDVDSTGQWLVSGSDDGTVRVWEISTARCVRIWNLYEPVISVAFNPNPQLPIVAASLTTGLALLHTGTGTPQQGAEVEHMLRAAPVFFKKAQEDNEGITSKLVADSIDDETIAKDRQAILQARKIAKICSWVSWWNRTKSDEAIMNEKLEDEKKELKVVKRNADGVESEDIEEHDEYDTTNGLARLFIRIDAGVKHVTWHSKGDYLATISPVATQTAVLIHRLSTAATQLPFKKSKGLVQKALFHPTQPIFFVATQKQVRVFHLVAQKPVKTLFGQTKYISSIDIHPSGNHVILGGYDRRIGWYEMDGSPKGFRHLRFHKKAVRSVAFHKKYPLFASASDDGDVHIYHSTVYDDYVTDPLIVPVKIIKAHVPRNDVGILQCKFHPKQPWIFTCASDNSIRLFC